MSAAGHHRPMNVQSRIRLAAHIIKQDRQIARAMKRVPRPVTWEWASPRLVPLLCGPRFDRPGEEIVRAAAGPGCAVEFGIDVGGVFPLVDRPVADRWECTAEQIRDAALRNLRRRVERLPDNAAPSGSLSGRMIRRLQLPAGCASSVLLLVDQLMRLFGPHDQVFGAPSRSLLLSFPLATPPRVVAHTIIDCEMDTPLPLMLDPFMLLDGELLWQPGDDQTSDAF